MLYNFYVFVNQIFLKISILNIQVTGAILTAFDFKTEFFPLYLQILKDNLIILPVLTEFKYSKVSQ